MNVVELLERAGAGGEYVLSLLEFGQHTGEAFACRIEVLVALSVGRIEQDVAQGLPHLQALRIRLGKVALGRQLMIDEAEHALLA